MTFTLRVNVIILLIGLRLRGGGEGFHELLSRRLTNFISLISKVGPWDNTHGPTDQSSFTP
jgi:hypothetical protein